MREVQTPDAARREAWEVLREQPRYYRLLPSLARITCRDTCDVLFLRGCYGGAQSTRRNAGKAVRTQSLADLIGPYGVLGKHDKALSH